ncbi:LysR family transcriptional regulator [Kushneria aurantia]|uniref:LysR family transcriptional regulator n=1 Tax=Kushneria aurantia TaxID=504092 RepID=A0ABV6FYE9_9GAMM|nr:LysR family transcriptional regulator [Kushneria aurantia]
MFDFKELEAFVWVVRLGSFSKVAERLHLTQPSISDRINRLEAAVGEPLLERSERPIQPTLRGREFHIHAERLLAGREEALQLFHNADEFTGTLRLGIVETIANSWFADFMGRLAERHPRLTIELTVDMSPLLHQRLIDNDLDMLFAMDGIPPGINIEQAPLDSYEMGMFVAPRHLEILRRDGLNALPFISFSRQARPWGELVGWLGEQGFEAPRIHSASTLMTIARMSAEGLGIGVLPVATIAEQVRQGELLQLELPAPLPPMVYKVIWRATSYSGFSHDVCALAQACANAYSEQHADDALLPRAKTDADIVHKN